MSIPSCNCFSGCLRGCSKLNNILLWVDAFCEVFLIVKRSYISHNANFQHRENWNFSLQPYCSQQNFQSITIFSFLSEYSCQTHFCCHCLYRVCSTLILIRWRIGRPGIALYTSFHDKCSLPLRNHLRKSLSVLVELYMVIERKKAKCKDTGISEILSYFGSAWQTKSKLWLVPVSLLLSTQWKGKRTTQLVETWFGTLNRQRPYARIWESRKSCKNIKLIRYQIEMRYWLLMLLLLMAPLTFLLRILD